MLHEDCVYQRFGASMTLTRPEISISVKRSKSPAMLGNSMSMLVNGPTVKMEPLLLTGGWSMVPHDHEEL